MKQHKHCFIYLTKNIVNNKCYIGYHTTNNLNDGYIGSGVVLNKALKKYGRNNFITGIIEFCEIEERNTKETYWIKKMNTVKPGGYNLTYGGDGGNTYILLSEENKKKFRENSSRTHKGKKLSIETKAKMSKSRMGMTPGNKGIPHTDETKNKMKKAWETRTPMTEETKRKIGKAGLGRKHSKETKRKIGEANSIRIWSDDSKQKISKKNKGLKRSKETIDKMKKKYACKYCGKRMNKSNLTRYHNDNCKKIQ